MQHVYFLQQWYVLADEALEDAIYDSQAMRDFIGTDLTIGSVPDAITASLPSSAGVAHIGVDAVTRLTHIVAVTSANIADAIMAGHLVRDDDKRVYGNAGYTGI